MKVLEELRKMGPAKVCEGAVAKFLSNLGKGQGKGTGKGKGCAD